MNMIPPRSNDDFFFFLLLFHPPVTFYSELWSIVAVRPLALGRPEVSASSYKQCTFGRADGQSTNPDHWPFATPSPVRRNGYRCSPLHPAINIKEEIESERERHN